jgi:AraC family transcriptional activator of tynA and feaB
MRHCTFGRGNLTNDDQEVFILSLIREGGGELTQLGRSARLGPGDLVIYDSGATFDYSLRAKTQLLKIPRRLLESKLDRPSDFLALKIDRSNPLSSILGELLTRCLDIDLSLDLGPRIAKRLSNAIVDLVASICDLERDAIPAAQVSRPLERVMRFARANLDDPDLGPETLAAAGPMSVRSLNRFVRCTRRHANAVGMVGTARGEPSRSLAGRGSLRHGRGLRARFQRPWPLQPKL